ncbi:MFS transporter [Bombilactobacillus bombi]|uniref:MFS transporter n=1 Tax=Bombilactobacillus bombi TaxID=1303590 RepID=A0A417ZHN4_9LACO|nr:MFS transporter [Bombilactobacillus bombi]RHW51093.1 MFS transporter [Bombilactobacillus bombi]
MKDEQQRWLLVMNATFNMVMGFILPVNTIFMTKNLHESMVVSGFVLMVYSGFMMLGNALGGYLFDHYSHRGTLLIGYLVAALGFLILSFCHTWPLYAIVLTVIGLGMGVSYTAVNSYTAVVAQQQRHHSQRIFNIMYLSANVGIALGSMLVSVIFQRSIFLTFFLPALCFITCLLIVIFRGHILDGTTHKHSNTTQSSEADIKEVAITSQISKPRLYLNLFLICLAVLVVWLGYSQWDSNMSLYMLNNNFKMRDYSLLFSLNALSLMIIQPLMGHLTESLFSQLKIQIALGLAIMGSSFIFLPGAQQYWQYVVSMLILTIGESITFPTIPALLSKFSTAQNRGTYQSFYVIFGSLGRALGPYLGSLVATKSSFDVLFMLICGTILAVAGGVALVKEA